MKYLNHILLYPSVTLLSLLIFSGGCSKQESPEKPGAAEKSISSLNESVPKTPVEEPPFLSEDGKIIITKMIKEDKIIPKGKEGAKWTGPGKFTLYYMEQIDMRTAPKTVKETAKMADGKRVSFYWSGTDSRNAHMEATVEVIDRKGTRRIGTRMDDGSWVELDQDSYGLGNKMNPLAPWRHVAADQSLYPFGSRLYVPLSDGKDNPKVRKEPLDGFFWVADTGGAIKGNLRFDVYVGSESVFHEMGHNAPTKRVEARIEPPPSLPTAWKPVNKDNIKKILQGIGLLPAGKPSDEDYKIALTKFQKQFKRIPVQELGNDRSAVTYWYLSQAAKQLIEADKITKAAGKVDAKPLPDEKKKEKG